MLRIDVSKAKSGMKLALPVQNPRVPARSLLKVGYELNDGIIQKLREHGVRSVWVRYPSLAFLERVIDLETIKNQQQIVAQVASTFEVLQTKSAAKLPYETYIESIQQLIDHLIGQPQSAVFLGDLAQAGAELMRHSSTVTYLSLLMGLKLEGYLVRERRHVNPARAKEVTNLGLGAMLHDIGVTAIEPEVRQRYEETGDETDPAWREHTAIGYRMVRGRVDPSAATVVLNHHQRYDGSGYTGADFPVLAEHSIHVFARIVAVADQFDRFRNPAGLPDQPTVWVLGAMTGEPLCEQFDPQVLQALLTVVPPYPPGSIVKLSDGRYAVCIDHNPTEPCRPVVQIIPDPKDLDVDDLPVGPIINLSEQPKRLCVVEHEGHDVREMNFTPPAHLTAPVKQLVW